MTSLPIAIPSSAGLEAIPEITSGENERFLLQAFRSFAEAAHSLERSYRLLRCEVERLHAELAQSHAGLARSLEENREMRRHLDRILDGLPCGVLVARSNGTISLVNPEGRRLLRALAGTSGSEMGAKIGSELNFAGGFECLSSLPGELRELFERVKTETGEREQCFKDGGSAGCWLAVRHAAVKDNEGQEDEGQGDASQDDKSQGDGNKGGKKKDNGDRESIFILREVSDAKRLVQEREKLRREQALAEMSAILAHEIRNPLGSLELFAGLLSEAGLSPECRQWVEHVQAGLRTLAATVNNVLHFHSLPAPERAPIDLGRLLDWAGGFLIPMTRQARVELCLRNRLQGVWFPADRHRLEQVLLNLVLNALRAMPGGGWVELSGHKICQGGAAAVAICVSDTGPGIQPEQVTKIFEPGFSTRSGSPGLGLAVCRKIVEQHGGRLEAGNRAGIGASFKLTFPLQEESRPEEFGQKVAG